jgi:hypothetical protein
MWRAVLAMSRQQVDMPVVMPILTCSQGACNKHYSRQMIYFVIHNLLLIITARRT